MYVWSDANWPATWRLVRAVLPMFALPNSLVLFWMSGDGFPVVRTSESQTFSCSSPFMRGLRVSSECRTISSPRSVSRCRALVGEIIGGSHSPSLYTFAPFLLSKSRGALRSGLPRLLVSCRQGLPRIHPVFHATSRPQAALVRRLVAPLADAVETRHWIVSFLERRRGLPRRPHRAVILMPGRSFLRPSSTSSFQIQIQEPEPTSRSTRASVRQNPRANTPVYSTPGLS